MKAKKAHSVGDVSAVSAQRLNVKISTAAHERLVVHCLKKRTTPGKLIESLIETSLREFRVQAISAVRVANEDRLDAPDGVTSPALAVA